MAAGSRSPSDPSEGHYFDTDPVVRSHPGEVRLVLPDASFTLHTDSGVFSPGRIDTGTKVLLLEMPALHDLPPGDLVDLGAGYGPVSCTLARRHPKRSIWAVEPNRRARELCRRNADTAGVGEQVKVVAPGGVPEDVRVAAVVSNPPIRIGKPALHELLEHWLARLEPDGAAWLVVQRNLGADSLALWLATRGWQAQRRRSRKGYRVLVVTQAGEPDPPAGEGDPQGA